MRKSVWIEEFFMKNSVFNKLQTYSDQRMQRMSPQLSPQICLFPMEFRLHLIETSLSTYSEKRTGKRITLRTFQAHGIALTRF